MKKLSIIFFNILIISLLDRGLDFTDEAAHLLTCKYPKSEVYPISLYPKIFYPIFKILQFDIYYFRVFLLCCLNISFLFAYNYIRNKKIKKESIWFFISIFLGNISFYASGQKSLSYDFISFFSFCLFICAAHNILNSIKFGLSILVPTLCALGRPTAGILVALFVPLFLFWKKPKIAIISCLCALSSVSFVFFCTGENYLLNIQEVAKSFPQYYTTNNIFKIYFNSLLEFTKSSANLLLVISICLIFYKLKIIKIKAFLSLSSCLVWIMLFKRHAHEFYINKVYDYPVYHLIFLLLICVTKSIPVTVLIRILVSALITPLFFAGSGVNPFYFLGFYLPIIWTLFFARVHIDTFEKKILASQIVCFVLVSIAINFCYPLRSGFIFQQSKQFVYNTNNKIKFEDELADSLVQIQKSVFRNKLPKALAISDLSGLLLLNNFDFPVKPMILGIHSYQSDQLKFVLKNMEIEDFQNSLLILRSGTKSIPLETYKSPLNCLLQRSLKWEINLPLYIEDTRKIYKISGR